MKAYLDILRNIIENGIDKSPTRRNPTTNEVEVVDGGVKTIGLPNLVFSHNMKDGFPLATCRKMPFKSMSVELEGFIRGITSKKWYQDRNCFYWRNWCNPSLIPEGLDWAEKKIFMEEEDDLGPIYGAQWAVFNGLGGCDQLWHIVDKLINSPDDRRMVCSAWNPNQFEEMALPPCHFAWSVTKYGNTLNLIYHMRSCDMIRGSNISTYGLLLELLAATAGLTPGNLTGTFADAHIYDRDIEQTKELIKREPKTLPNIRFTNNSGQLKEKFHIFDWTYQDVELLNYNPHEAMKFAPVVV